MIFSGCGILNLYFMTQGCRLCRPHEKQVSELGELCSCVIPPYALDLFRSPVAKLETSSLKEMSILLEFTRWTRSKFTRFSAVNPVNSALKNGYFTLSRSELSQIGMTHFHFGVHSEVHSHIWSPFYTWCVIVSYTGNRKWSKPWHTDTHHDYDTRTGCILSAHAILFVTMKHWQQNLMPELFSAQIFNLK